MIRILIADDHAIVRAGLKQIVSEESDMKVVGEAGNADELFDMLQQDEYDIVILDINMPGKTGLEALKEIKIQYRKLPVLILSMYSEEHYGLRALKAGSSGYLKKVSAPDELVKAIRKIVSGKKYISQTLAESMADNFGKDITTVPHERLSDREYEVMCKIASGETAEKIAAEFSISVHTVYSYRNRIFEKMNMKSNVEITRYVLQNNLLN